MKQKTVDDASTRAVASHFLDSGAFTLWTKSAEYAKRHGKGRWDYYHTKGFRRYLDEYAAFVKEFAVGIDLYANVDVIPNPELTYRNQKYLEERHGLRPVPVVHYTTDLKWLRRYINEGYEVIGLGGLVGRMKQPGCRRWVERSFELVCDQPSRLPKVKLHGFGVMDYLSMVRYPWWSVDSTRWTKVGGFGNILVPHRRKGRFVFDLEPYIIKVSQDDLTDGSRFHYLSLSPQSRAVIDQWLKSIGVPLGLNKPGTREPLVLGVINQHAYRRAACLLFLEAMRKSLPDWPWPYRPARGAARFGRC